MEMMVNGRDDQCHHHHHLELGLGLGLGMAGTTAPVVEAPQRALSVAPISSLPAAPPQPQPQCWNGAGLFFPSSAGDQQRAGACVHAGHRVAAYHEMPFLRGIDVNRAPAGERSGSCSEEDEEPGASSLNSTLSSLSGKRGAPARSGGEHDMRAGSDDEDSGAGGGSRKKLRLSKDQSAVLEESFKEHNTLNPRQKAALAKQLNLKPRQVEVWFQNRRARTKLKQTEVVCEFLKRCCGTLTEENRRLHKEVQELRALKLVLPQLYMRMPPPTTLTVCPSCERLVSGTGKPDATANEGRPALARPLPSGPWGPVPTRPMFVDKPAQRS